MTWNLYTEKSVKIAVQKCIYSFQESISQERACWLWALMTDGQQDNFG